MSPFVVIALLFGVCGAGVVAPRGELARSESSDTKPDFNSFGEDLGLSSAQIQGLGDKYAQACDDITKVPELACLTAQLSLGEADVDTRPVNTTVVDENWTKTCWVEPYCVIQPSNSSQVSRAVKIIRFFEVKFAVRSGGHSPNPGWSSIDSQGVLVDLQKLKSVSLSQDASFASVGPGARWGEVYAALDTQNAVVMGARLPTVGVGGAILGGGYFHTSTQYGLVADSAKNFEVVLSNGSIVDASADKNADLFWALKGGGPNFGIVTGYDLFTIPPSQVWVQINLYSVDQALDIISAFHDWQNNGSSDFKSNIELQIALDVIAVVLIYSEPVAQPPAAFASFLAIPPLQVALPPFNVTVNQLSQILATTISNVPARHDYRGYSSRIDVELTQEIYTFWREKALAVRNATGAAQTFVLQHVGVNMIQKGIDKGGNPLNLAHENQLWWTTIADWENQADDDVVRSVSIETTAQWEKLGVARGANLPFIYMNDASRDQNPLASYGADNLSKLKYIALKYDPERIFQVLQNGGFLLSKA